jgi:3-deoxy-D-manno-octulosonate 8-phosphate phosphatase (KDO 8-P phosphatase)
MAFRIDEKAAAIKINNLKMLIFDVDGVLTNGDLIFGSDGTEYKSFSVQDGLGFTLARQAGLKTGIITARTSTIVERRAAELKVDAFSQGDNNKLPAFENMLEKYELYAEQVAYMGDDLLDLVLLDRVGFSAAPANAQPEVLQRVDYVTFAQSGNGAAREVIQVVLKFQNKWQRILENLEKN